MAFLCFAVHLCGHMSLLLSRKGSARLRPLRVSVFNITFEIGIAFQKELSRELACTKLDARVQNRSMVVDPAKSACVYQFQGGSKFSNDENRPKHLPARVAFDECNGDYARIDDQ
jgi:hypothetical protein